MKIMIASDIHGSAACCRKLLSAYNRENPDKLLLLGDILYHGPRNALPEEYAPKAVIEMLNPLKDKILCVRGNCEAEVDQMVLSFPVLADYAVILNGGITVYATHGHIFSEDNPPPLAKGSVLLCGHTHIPKCVNKGAYTYINPGSVSIPKDGSQKSYMVMEENRFTWKNLDGEEYNSIKI